MTDGDFFANERSITTAAATSVRIELAKADGSVQVRHFLRVCHITPQRRAAVSRRVFRTPFSQVLTQKPVALKAGEVLDATVMRKDMLVRFYQVRSSLYTPYTHCFLCGLHNSAMPMLSLRSA